MAQTPTGSAVFPREQIQEGSQHVALASTAVLAPTGKLRPASEGSRLDCWPLRAPHPSLPAAYLEFR